MPIAALVLGIVGLVFAIVPCLGMFALPLTLIAVILGVIGMKAPKDGSPQKGKGMAVAGLVMGIIGTLIGAYWLYAYLTVRGQFEKGMKEGWDKGIHDMNKSDADKDLDKSMKDLHDSLQQMKDVQKDLKDMQPDKPAEAPAAPADKPAETPPQ